MIEEQESGKLARREKLNEIIGHLNPLLNIRGENGIRVEVSDSNIVITIDDEGKPTDEDESSSEEFSMWVCEIIGGVPTAVRKTFFVKPEEE